MSDTLTLRELVTEVTTLDEFLLEAEGELTPELEQLLTDVNAKLELKVEGVGRHILQEGQRVDAIKAEEQRLAARRKAIENRVRWLKESYLREMLSRLGTDKLKGTLCSVSLQNNPPSVKGELDELTLRELAVIAPQLVRRVPESFTLDRKAALEYHKAGQALPAGLAVEQSASIRIR